jgi:hypothetical protein
MKKKYPSKIGFIAILPLLFILLLTILWLIFNKPDWWFFLPCISPLLFVYTLHIPTYYTIDESSLIIKSGLFSKIKIDIATIRKIRETNSLLTSPALSADRIEIKYKKYDWIMISPKNKFDFIQDLININPTIEVQYKIKDKN